MAFNRPIEADRPDDLGLLSAFVRAPVVGTLMWMIGGDMAKDLEEEELMREKADTTTPKESNADNDLKKENGEPLTPGRISSEVSEADDLGECSTMAIEDLSINNYQQGGRSLASQKKMRASWSDESGQSLVEYLDETTSHEPLSAAQPVKSAIRRSRTMYANAQHGMSNHYIPSGINGGGVGSGIVMPSGGGLKSSNGYISPQWGWYVSTTPPQAEMYSKKSIDKKDREISDDVQSRIKPSSIAPLPVFTKGISTPKTGWPSVPL